MTEITATMVKQLRDATSAGMMDCKRALQETDGDFDEAVKILREKGMASAAKRADRETSEGIVLARVDGSVGTIVAVGCETEPVSKNEDFRAFADSVLDAAFEGGDPGDLEEQRVDVASRQETASSSTSTFTRRRTRSARSCWRAEARRSSRTSSRCTSPRRGRRSRPETRSRPSSSTPSGRS